MTAILGIFGLALAVAGAISGCIEHDYFGAVALVVGGVGMFAIFVTERRTKNA